MNPTSQSCRPLSASSTTSSSTIRPRNRRLEPALDEHVDPAAVSSGNANARLESPVTSPRPSRAVSPIPSRHPSQPVLRNASEQSSLSDTCSSLRQPPGRDGPTNSIAFTSGLWGNSWSTLQGLASTVLGNDNTEDGKDKPNTSLRPRRRRMLFSDAIPRRKASTHTPTHWGPKGAPHSTVGVGSKESRDELVRAKRRENLLAANGHALDDPLGRFKRRSSDDRASSSAPPADQDDRDALVYVHRVRSEDTLAGVLIKFNCQPAAFRKANRLWPNDSIQTRKTVVLPVDACAVKGKPIPEPPCSPDFTGGDGAGESTPTMTNGPWVDFSAPAGRTSGNTTTDTPSVSSTSEHHDDPPWKHDSWVEIEGHPTAIEIARLPRRALGYFPRGRRKSGAYSDLDTPPLSLDIPRLPPSESSLGRLKTRSSSGSYFEAHLHGPGGVGTLGKNVRGPGPEQDGLNRLFAAHLPSVAPRESFESTTSASSTGLENVGGAIEGWVRKIATKAATIVEGTPTKGRVEGGDLIELSDAFEIGDEEMGDAGNIDDSRIAGLASARQDQDTLLRERFPPRGRMLQVEGKGIKGD
ncbi:MAG: hypothetical protein M1835_000496 [Candelina submexicana]|nr:MAG: hypothetical protein M1835_000496 [Candelina submexicana]